MERQRYELAVRRRVHAVASLSASAAPVSRPRSALLEQVIALQSRVGDSQNRLVELWTSFRAEQLALYHDLGVLPYDDWKGFLAHLTATPSSGGHDTRANPAKATTRDIPGLQPLPSSPGH